MSIDNLLYNIKYINIHTHSDNNSDNTLNIINILLHELSETKRNVNKLYSIGLHPWYIKNALHCIHEIISVASDKNIAAIGEIGMDKLVTVPFDKQTEVFLKQINIAVSFHKPVIIHCVKAYSELLEILNKYNIMIPSIIHGFNENEQIADQLMKYKICFSFGKNILKSGSKAVNVLKELPPDRVFFETDDSDINIQDIYLKASEITGKTEDFWIEQCKNNFVKCFNNG